MRNYHSTLFVVLLTVTSLLSQDSKRTNIWYFGRNAGIDFNTSPPTPLLDGALNIWEGCATFCNTKGKILIYTDGNTIWDRNHQIIPNATELGGNNSVTQSGIIVPAPNSESLLYVFSVDSQERYRGIQYAVVDLLMNEGLGGIVTKNNRLLDKASEKITAIPHSNSIDYWILAHEVNNNVFASWLLTENGISPTPEFITIGSNHYGVRGYMKASPTSTKLITTTGYGRSAFELFDFDNCTGEISNPITLTHSEFDNPYGVEFSPNGKLLYLAGAQNSPIHLYQVNISLSNEQDILNSITFIAKGIQYYGAIQNAPDGKIYIAQETSEYLSVIENPNVVGINCNYVHDGFYLGGRKSAFGLPNLIPSLFVEKPQIELSSDLNFCDGTGSLQATTNIESDRVIYQWYFNDELIPNQSSTQIQASSSGAYTLKISASSECQTEPSVYSQQINILFPELLDIRDIELNHPICDTNNGSISISALGGTPPYRYSLNNGATFQNESNMSNLASGIYGVAVQDANGCVKHQMIELNVENKPEINDVQIIKSSCGLANGSLTINASGGIGQLQYAIDEQTSQLNNSFNNLSSGVYAVTVIDSLGCFAKTTREIATSTIPSVDLIQANFTTCNQDNGIIEVSGNGGTAPYQFSIDKTNFQTNGRFEKLQKGIYEIIIQDALGCRDTIQLEIESEEPPSINNIETKHTSCGENNGEVSLNVIGGIEIRYSIDGINFQSTNKFGNLPAGNYNLVIQDSNGCQDFQTINIEPSETLKEQFLEVSPTTCGETNGSLEVLTNDNNIKISMDGIIFQQEKVFNNLIAGEYSVLIQDENGCILDYEVEIGSSTELSINSIQISPARCGNNNGSFLINIEGGDRNPKMSVNSADYQPITLIRNLSSGQYDIQISDEIGCSTDTTIFIVREDCAIYLPNTFSPNNDGINDLFQINVGAFFKGEFKSFRVFNRWGGKIFEVKNFKPEEVGWDGRFRKKDVEEGVYFYSIEYIANDGKRKVIGGDVTILKER